MASSNASLAASPFGDAVGGQGPSSQRTTVLSQLTCPQPRVLFKRRGAASLSNLANVNAFVVSGTSSFGQLSIKNSISWAKPKRLNHQDYSAAKRPNCPKLAVSLIEQESFIHCANLDDEPCTF